MDPQSLDAAVQNTLAVLYPPFDITAPTVLSQLFRVLEARYHGDGLCCLLDFLIPSKRLLEHVRQAACAPYFNCVFHHEGWPLCLHEKVVVHLGPLNPLLLRPGDFYLQAEPCGEQSACLVFKCLSSDLTTVEKVTVPETSCSLLFTQEWLEEINHDLNRPTLHTCLVATGNGIVPVPWSKIVIPEFVHVPKNVEQGSPECPESSMVSNPSRQQNSNVAGESQGGREGGLRATRGKYPGLIKVEQGAAWKKVSLFVLPSLCDIISENLEGEYVNLLEYSEERPPALDLASAGSAPQQPGREVSPKARQGALWVNGEAAMVESWTCGKGQSSEGGPCTPCLRRKLSQDSKSQELRCRYRESYVAALQNPISFSSGLMAAILEEMDISKQELTSKMSDMKPTERSGEATASICTAHPVKDGKSEQGHFKPLLKSPPECVGAAASNKFSFLKGHRHLLSSGGGLSGAEKAGKGPEGPWKKMSLVCSPRMARAKLATAGKGNPQVDVVLPELAASTSTDGVTANARAALLQESPSMGSSPPELVLWESLTPELLSSGIACLPGNTDKLGRPIVQISTSGCAWQAPWCSTQEVTRLLLSLCSIPRKPRNDSGVTVVIDARKDPPSPTLFAALGSIQQVSPESIHAVLLLAEKEAAPHLEKLPGLQVELLSSLKALGRHVDSAQLTQALDGSFPYCHSEWLHYFQKMHPFVSDLKKASELLQRSIQELDLGGLPESFQEASQQVERHQQLMQDVLCNAQLVSLQREGGATMARLRKEAARLSFSPDVRKSIDYAETLYNLVEEDVHMLVTKSNSRLEHLEFLLKIRELEAEFTKLSLWFDEEGSSELHEPGSEESSREKTEESYRRFKEFFKEATVYYNRGLALSKEAAQVKASQFPEMGAFEVAKGAFQAKLTTFYMAMEMKQAELETLLDLYRFCDQVTQLNHDCKLRLASWQSGEGEPKSSTESLQKVQHSLQLLSREFSVEMFQQMKVQASSMRSGKGLAVWSEALERSRETKQILEDTLAKFKEDREAGARDSRQKDGPLTSELNAAPKDPDEESCLHESSWNGDEQEETLGCKRRAEANTTRGSRTVLYINPLCHEGSTGAGLASRNGDLECKATEAQGLGGLHPPTQNSSSTLPPQASSCLSASQVPRICDTLPPIERFVPGKRQRNRKKETAQYFQLSRHGSCSSEDTDSQHSTEESLNSSATLPMDSAGAKGAWTQERALGIIYLENHHTDNPPKATTQ